MGRGGRSRRRAEPLRAEKTAAANAADYIPPTFISVPSPTTSRAKMTVAVNEAKYAPPTSIPVPSPITSSNPAITTPRPPRPYGEAAAFTATAPTAAGNSPVTPRTPRLYGVTTIPAPSASTTQFSEIAQSTTSQNSTKSAGAASSTSADTYIFSAVRWGGAVPPSPTANHDSASRGANPAPTSKPAGRGLRRQTGSRHLANASKHSQVGNAPEHSETHNETTSDIEHRERTAKIEALLKAQRELLQDQGNILVQTTPLQAQTQEAPFNPKAWREDKPMLNGYPKSAPFGPAPPLSRGRFQAWRKTHEIPRKSQKPAMPRDDEETGDRQLAFEAFEAAEKEGKTEIDISLVREIVDYFEDKVEELTIMLCDDRGKIAEVNQMVQERIFKVDQTNRFHRQLLELKTLEGGGHNKLQDGVDLPASAELEVEVEQSQQDNAEMKENYEFLEEDHKIANEGAELDRKLLEGHEEKETNKKDKRIKELEKRLEERENQIALSGLTSRPKLRTSPSVDLPGDSHSRTSSESRTFDDSSSARTSRMSNSSKDSSVSSAKANIHLLEMQYHNSRRQYSLAAAAGAEAEKHLDASSDLKTALIIKALRASTLALRRDSADGDIEAARRLFEDAIFLGQIMKGEESGEKRREGKVWEDKCHAWLWHLADVEAKRKASIAGSAFRSRGTSLEFARGE